DYVDHTKPVTTKTYGEPRVPDDPYHPQWITSNTEITFTADDGSSMHDSGVRDIYYGYVYLENPDDWHYCSENCNGWSEDDRFMTGLPTAPEPYNPSSPPSIYLPQDSCYVIEYYSVDHVDKTEDVKWQCVFVDNTPPTVDKDVGTPKVESTQITEYMVPEPYDVKDTAWYVTQNTLITLTCEDLGTHPVNDIEIYYKYYNDGQLVKDWTLYTESFKYNEDTYHELYYYCVDALGNKGEVHYELDIVDTVPPESWKEFEGLKVPCSELDCANKSDCDYYINQDTKIYLYCEDPQPHPVNDVKIYYRYFVDDALHQDWTEYNGPIQYDEDSKHTLEWYCVDALGNKENTRVQVERVDTEPPVTTKTIGEPKWDNGYWVTSQTPITLTTVDKEYPCASGPATLYYQIWWDNDCDNNLDVMQYSGSVTVDENCKLEKTLYLQGECLHEIRWYAIDALGNEENDGEWITQQHKVDNTPPHVLILKPVDGWYSDGEDIPIVAIAEDLNSPFGPCEEDCDGLGTECAVGIEDGAQCYAYLLDILPEPKIVELETEGTFLYNADAKECQGDGTIPAESGIPDGVVILVVRAEDNLGNAAGSLAEILRAVLE
ncbi:MAG: hypothetical protein KAU24_03720, partial [Candidatus Aenigmarchaeota archaeon]|nr:hypothetical protein [Candidatus Aenigmarchaeota archaeon]